MKLLEFIGTPRAGKTTQIKLLKRYLEKRGLRVKVVTDRFRASHIKTPPNEVIAYKLVFFSKALEDYFRYKDKYDVMIIDRGFYDSIIWFETERRLGHLTPKRADELKKTFFEYTKKVDKIVCLLINPEESQLRHTKTKHMKVDDVGMSKSYLEALRKAYQSYRNQWPNCLYITDQKAPSEIHRTIVGFIEKE